MSGLQTPKGTRGGAWPAWVLAPVILIAGLATEVRAQPYSEAPQLTRQVAAGELPPANERLPENPLVVYPYERVGSYGGEWRTALMGGADTAWLQRTLGYENLVRWDPEWNEIIPNLAASFEANDDGTEYTFTLRAGMRWSDGEPFTANDILFWHEDVFLRTCIETLEKEKSGKAEV